MRVARSTEGAVSACLCVIEGRVLTGLSFGRGHFVLLWWGAMGVEGGLGVGCFCEWSSKFGGGMITCFAPPLRLQHSE